MGEGGTGLENVTSPPTTSNGQIGGASELVTGTTSKETSKGRMPTSLEMSPQRSVSSLAESAM